MKKLTVVILSLLAGGFVMTANADNQDQVNLQACNSNIEMVMGGKVTTRLYGIQHRRSGDRLRLNVYAPNSPRQQVNCWVSEEGGVSLRALNGMALNMPQLDDADEQISLVD
ncbi:MAG: hypothetical protein ACK5ME_09915 [Parahaliea sp.]